MTSRLPIRLSLSSGVPFYRQIVDQISELIRSGRLVPEPQLPSFRELAPQLLVSLITVRRAYADLEAWGMAVYAVGSRDASPSGLALYLSGYLLALVGGLPPLIHLRAPRPLARAAA